MKKQVKLKVTETAVTNSDFYNLFRPIAPSIDLIGKVAQVISGLTEAVTIWYITQSELSGLSKSVSILISIVAMLLVVAVLELGGRKFLQVLTRAVVWKRFQNVWYISLFTIVSVVTIGMGVLSFRLSTNGIHHAFVSGVELPTLVFNKDMKADYKDNIAELKSRFDSELSVIKNNHQELLSGKAEQYDARIKSALAKVKEYERKYANGESWAMSHADKYRKKAIQLDTDKAVAVSKVKDEHIRKVEQWQVRKNEKLTAEKALLAKAEIKQEKLTEKRQSKKMKYAEFWGGMFSLLVGFSVLLAFVCIISVEVFRRGSGIKVEYEEEDQEPSIVLMFLKGFVQRWRNFFKKKAMGFAQLPSQMPSQAIGYNRSGAFASGSADADFEG